MTQHDVAPFDALPRGTRRLFVDVSDKAAECLAVMASKAGVSRNLYVSQLFNAAYAARCAPTGDRALDAAVGGGAPPATAPRLVAISTAPAGVDSAEVKRQLAAARDREKALGAELATARKSLLDATAQIAHAARIEREGEALKSQLAEAKARIAALAVVGEAAKRDLEERAGLRDLLAAARGEVERQKDQLAAARRLRDRESEELADQLEAAEATIGELKARLEAALVDAAPAGAPGIDMAELGRLAAALRADLARVEQAVCDWTGQVETAAKAWRGSSGVDGAEAAIETLRDGAGAEKQAPSSVSLRAPPIGALTAAEVKIVRGWAAAGNTPREIAVETGFSPEQIAAVLKKRAA